MDTLKSDSSWLHVCGMADPERAADLSQRVRQKIDSATYKRDDVVYIEKLRLPVVKGDLHTSPERLEKLRRLCQLWDVEIKIGAISSHRPLIGPIIVAVKRIAFPILKILLKDFIKQQRDFNAAVISLAADLAQEKPREDAPSAAA